ncbi:polyketide synthase [Nocardia sp. CDC159]|uniref:Polyketide synthase n=1 Tax=Nocardia pulmonis TaxID=2951408 RepID=A0A9X2E7J8_9NOCA|nr:MULTISPECIES: polyketide synthase [Nocardia]MCM6774315.1 polyketide synthase [Nocardia pulmonis]MCM6787619.1 polyketide synthase [Nocardia sp. CDC159]
MNNRRYAIVGIALRAPGGITDPDGLRAALHAGAVLIEPPPPERRGTAMPSARDVVPVGGFLRDVLDFDARFFGISPREARVMDPQQRLLLEVVWEAFEDAALRPGDTPGTGVFVGISGLDYRRWFDGAPSAHWTAGNGLSFAAGRISYLLGFHGPSFAVDTACSSSLVALYTACRALDAGDCEQAVVGGVNLLLSPWTTVALQRTGALSASGRSLPLDHRADGYVRAEGCAAIVVKPLTDATRAGDRVLAVIEGIGVNHDGATPTLAAPNPDAQAALLSRVLAAAELEPGAIGYHETHGTGTRLGDDSELRALVRVHRDRGGTPLYLGSIKANIGHAEAASGLLGIAKLVVGVRDRILFPQPGFERFPTGAVPEEVPLRVCREPTPWTEVFGASEPRLSISSFGMSGTNVCAVLSPGPRARPPEVSRAVSGFAVTAADAAALQEVSARYRLRLREAADGEYPAFARAATHGRSRLRHTAWIAAATRAEAVEALEALAEGRTHPRVRVLAAGEPYPVREVSTRPVYPLPLYPWRRGTFAVERTTESGSTQGPAQ